jgi:hypothetical protein
MAVIYAPGGCGGFGDVGVRVLQAFGAVPMVAVLGSHLSSFSAKCLPMRSFYIEEHAAVPKAVLDSGTRAMHDYTVGLVFNRSPAGSGTLVSLGGVQGILTAEHVVRNFLKREAEPIGLIITNQVHSFGFSRDEWFDKQLLEICVIGEPANRDKPGDGPDLAFIRILDPVKLARIAAIKSFYPLDLRGFEAPAGHPLESIPMFIAGMPYDLCEEQSPDIIESKLLIAAAQISSKASRGNFDFLTVGLRADERPFPLTYAGVSGGGLWYLPLCRDDSHPQQPFWHMNPVLAGVAFFEIDRSPHVDLICHGPTSIYGIARPAILDHCQNSQSS